MGKEWMGVENLYITFVVQFGCRFLFGLAWRFMEWYVGF